MVLVVGLRQVLLYFLLLLDGLLFGGRRGAFLLHLLGEVSGEIFDRLHSQVFNADALAFAGLCRLISQLIRLLPIPVDEAQSFLVVFVLG